MFARLNSCVVECWLLWQLAVTALPLNSEASPLFPTATQAMYLHSCQCSFAVVKKKHLITTVYT